MFVHHHHADILTPFVHLVKPKKSPEHVAQGLPIPGANRIRQQQLPQQQYLL
jgi:hypothetical protein